MYLELELEDDRFSDIYVSWWKFFDTKDRRMEVVEMIRSVNKIMLIL